MVHLHKSEKTESTHATRGKGRGERGERMLACMLTDERERAHMLQEGEG